MTQIKNNKLIVITRKDLLPGYQALQSSHAAIQFQYDHPNIASEWNKKSKYLIFLSVENYNEFIKLIKKLINNDIRMSLFYEPDIDEYTAVAIEPGEKSRKLTSNLPLMLKEIKEK